MCNSSAVIQVLEPWVDASMQYDMESVTDMSIKPEGSIRRPGGSIASVSSGELALLLLVYNYHMCDIVNKYLWCALS